MKRRLVSSAIAVVWLVGSVPSVIGQADPVALFRQFVEARTRGDVAGAVSVFTDDAMYRGGACRPCVGKAAIRAEIERRVAQRIATAIIASKVSDNVAQVRVVFTTAEMRTAHQKPEIAIATVELRGDKISSLRFTLVSDH